jgi:hypothetical protein
VDLVGSHGRWKRPCLQTAQVIAFNKTPISTLAELAELVTASKDKYLRYHLPLRLCTPPLMLGFWL